MEVNAMEEKCGAVRAQGTRWSLRKWCFSSIQNLIRQKGGNLWSLWWKGLYLFHQLKELINSLQSYRMNSPSFRYFPWSSVVPLVELHILINWALVPLKLFLGCHSLRYPHFLLLEKHGFPFFCHSFWRLPSALKCINCFNSFAFLGIPS